MKFFLLAATLTFFEILILFVVFWSLTYSGIKPIENLGNFDVHVHAVASQTPEKTYTFGVLGDTRETPNVSWYLCQKLQNSSVKFIVNTGDFVSHAKEVYFSYFLNYLKGKLTVPVFVIPGNHDVNKEEDRGNIWFEKALGPKQIYFSYGPDLFILADNSLEEEIDHTQWLTQVLEKESKGKRHIFVFLHCPLFKVEKKDDYVQIDPNNPLHQLFKKYGVTYVFLGHYHSYVRTNAEGVNYIISAGGGAPLYGKRAFYHALLITVSDKGIQENIFRTYYRFGIFNELKKAVYTKIVPIFKNAPGLFWIGTVLMQGLIVFLMALLIKK
jgi:predicted phosphodiesterase